MLNLNENRVDLAKKYFKGIGVEVGIEQGVYSEEICKANPGVKLYCVDPWRAYRSYRDHTRQSKLDKFYEITKKRLEPYNCTILKLFSNIAVREFADNSLDFVYIDANHSYEYALEDITLWFKKVRSGGVLAGHDYIRRKGQDQYYAVVSAVDEFVKNNKDMIGELIIYRGDEAPSWMFIKP